MIIYFAWPLGGDVYSVNLEEEFDPKKELVRLPGKMFVRLELSTEGPAIATLVPKPERDSFIGRTHEARLIFREKETIRVFEGKWKPFIEPLNAAAATNTLFTIILTEKEFNRLKGGGLARLKKFLSPEAARRVSLTEKSWVRQDRPALDLHSPTDFDIPFLRTLKHTH